LRPRNREKVQIIIKDIFERSADRCQIEFEAAGRIARSMAKKRSDIVGKVIDMVILICLGSGCNEISIGFILESHDFWLLAVYSG
jgi:hypothetical protein